MMKQSNTRRFYAFVLAMMAVGSLAACSQTDRTVTQVPADGTSEVRGYEEQQGVGDVARVNQTQGGGEFFNNLQEGQPVNYYSQEFQRMGYEVMDVNRMGDQISYDLRKGDERFIVNLTTDERNNQVVSNIDTREYRRVGAGQEQNQQGAQANQNNQRQQQGGAQANNQQDQEMNRIVQEVEKMQPGKKPIEYLPMLSKWGQVREFSSNDNNASAEVETNNNRNFQVEMKVDPQRQVVTDIQVDDNNFWSL